VIPGSERHFSAASFCFHDSKASTPFTVDEPESFARARSCCEELGRDHVGRDDVAVAGSERSSVAPRSTREVPGGLALRLYSLNGSLQREGVNSAIWKSPLRMGTAACTRRLRQTPLRRFAWLARDFEAGLRRFLRGLRRRCFRVSGFLHNLLATSPRARGLSLRPTGDVASWMWAFARTYWRHRFMVVSFRSDLLATSLHGCELSLGPTGDIASWL
jgi:hypothetical protein